MKTLAKTLALTLFAGIVSSNVMASTAVADRFVEIDGNTYKLTQVTKNNYDVYAAQLKSNLSALQQTQDLAQFQRLANETLDLVINAKNAVAETFVDRMDSRDNQVEKARLNYQQWKLAQLINSLESASKQDSLTSAKDNVLFSMVNAI